LAAQRGVPVIFADKVRTGAESVSVTLDDASTLASARDVVVVDDLITSGATLEATAAVIRQYTRKLGGPADVGRLGIQAVATHFRPTESGISRLRRSVKGGIVNGVLTTDSTGHCPQLNGLTIRRALPFIRADIAAAFIREPEVKRAVRTPVRPLVENQRGPLEPAPPALAVSVICLDLTRVAEEVKILARLGVSRLHVDFTEPGFGGGLGLPLELVGDLRSASALPIDAHVMLDHPERFVDELVARGVDQICVHQRAVNSDNLPSMIRISDQAALALAVDPGESVDLNTVRAIRPTTITVMAVDPGGAGRAFRPEILATIEEASRCRTAGLVHAVEVDGAVGPSTAHLMVAAGATALVLGSRAIPGRHAREHLLAELRSSLTPARR
jgi:pentose-5-phosphate-3-epimerase